MYFGLCLGARAHLGAHAPLACGRPWLIPSPARLRKLQKRQGRFKSAKGISKTIKSYGWYCGLSLGATVGQVWTARLYFKHMLPPHSFKIANARSSCVLTKCITKLSCGGVPQILQKARAPREPRRGQSLAISCTLFPASVPGPTSVRTRPWHVVVPGLSRAPSPTLPEASKTLRQIRKR